jgi:hypothetical protein
MARKISYEEEDSRQLRKPNAHERKQSSRQDRKHFKRSLTDYTCLEDALDDEDYDEYEY